jgi:chromosome partitioning protein
MASIVTIGSEKGGVGKTTTTVNLASSFAALGKKVLVVDIDPQANATDLLGVDQEQAQSRALAQAILNKETLETCQVETNTEGVDLLPATPGLKEVINQLGTGFRQDKLLKPVLTTRAADNYDMILIDTHGVEDCLLISALAVSHYYLVPVFAEQDSARGLHGFLRTSDRIREYCNPTLTLVGVVITRYDRGNATHREYEEAIREQGKRANFRVFESLIPSSKSVAAASKNQMSLLAYRKDSPVTLAYQSLAGELLPLLKGRRVGRVTVPDVEKFEGGIEEIENIFEPEAEKNILF